MRKTFLVDVDRCQVANIVSAHLNVCLDLMAKAGKANNEEHEPDYNLYLSVLNEIILAAELLENMLENHYGVVVIKEAEDVEEEENARE